MLLETSQDVMCVHNSARKEPEGFLLKRAPVRHLVPMPLQRLRHNTVPLTLAASLVAA